MHVLNELVEMLEEDIKKTIKKGDITPEELGNIYKAVDIIKDVETIKAMREYDDEETSYGYSRTGGYSEHGGRRYTGHGYSRTGNVAMVHKLEDMLQSATTEEQRKAIMNCIDAM